MKYIHIITTLTAFFLGSTLLAQANQVELTGCTDTDNNGIYTPSGFVKNGAPCYISENDPFLTLELSATGWVFGEYIAPWTPCDDDPFASNQYASDLNTDVTQVVSDGTTCGSTASIIVVPTVPTLSEWGVIVSFLLIAIFAVTSIKQTSRDLQIQ